jgi:hypothetical protein
MVQFCIETLQMHQVVMETVYQFKALTHSETQVQDLV